MPFFACVQTKLELEAFVTSQGFAFWILEQTKHALETRDSGEAALVAFPELIGLPLLFLLNRQTSAATVQAAALEWAGESWLEALVLGVQHQNLSPSSFILPRATTLFTVFWSAFSQAAKATNSFIVAGTNFLPSIELEAAKGLHLANGRVQNVSFLFAPSGKIILRSPKQNLTAGLEKRIGLSCGQLENMASAVTPFGKVTTLVCYDAFFETILERTDALGTSILVQPSANAALWEGTWSGDKTKIEGQEWLARGVAHGIQGRVNIRYALNPMLVGKLFDLEFEGRSSINANTSLVGGEPILSIAKSHTDFEVVTARVSDFS